MRKTIKLLISAALIAVIFGITGAGSVTNAQILPPLPFAFINEGQLNPEPQGEPDTTPEVIGDEDVEPDDEAVANSPTPAATETPIENPIGGPTNTMNPEPATTQVPQNTEVPAVNSPNPTETPLPTPENPQSPIASGSPQPSPANPPTATTGAIASPTPLPTVTPTATASPTSEPTATPTVTPDPTSSPTPSPTPQSSATPEPTQTPEPTETPDAESSDEDTQEVAGVLTDDESGGTQDDSESVQLVVEPDVPIGGVLGEAAEDIEPLRRVLTGNYYLPSTLDTRTQNSLFTLSVLSIISGLLLLRNPIIDRTKSISHRFSMIFVTDIPKIKLHERDASYS